MRAKWNTIFTAPHRRVPLGLAIAFFANLFAAFAFFNWIPTVLVERGFTLKVALEGAFIFNLFGGPGAVLIAALISRLGSRAGLLAILMAAIISVLCLVPLLHQPDLSVFALMICLAAVGATVAGFQAGLYALAAAAYPTECRSAGIGTVVGTGRIGAMSSAFAGGAILSIAGGDYYFFGSIAAMLVMAAIGVVLVNRHIARASKHPA